MKREPDPSNVLIELRCPGCGHNEARFAVTSRSVFSVECTRCAHVWSADVELLIDAVRKYLTLHSQRTT